MVLLISDGFCTNLESFSGRIWSGKCWNDLEMPKGRRDTFGIGVMKVPEGGGWLWEVVGYVVVGF